jgi:lipoprotein-releasing system ATP-binding protein
MGNLELRNINKSYGETVKTPVLRDISLTLSQGEFAAIIGQSGSGKTTLLNMIGVLDRPDSGEALYDGQNLYTMTDDQLAEFRNHAIGFVFQFHHLLPEFNALENVLIPHRVHYGSVQPGARERAKSLLERVGVGARMYNRATNLSGGQQQRVAIARALMNEPRIILADEPTGNLDSDSGESIRALLREINRDSKTTFVIVTHDRHIAASCDRVIELADGVVLSDISVDPSNAEASWNALAPCYCRMRKQG